MCQFEIGQTNISFRSNKLIDLIILLYWTNNRHIVILNFSTVPKDSLFQIFYQNRFTIVNLRLTLISLFEKFKNGNRKIK